MTPTQEIEWTKNAVHTITIGGVWMIPRSGITFTRTDENTLALTDRMPHMPDMIITPDQLWDIQTEDFECVALRARAAGFTCTDNTTKPTPT